MNSVSQKSTNYVLLKRDEKKVMDSFKSIFVKITTFFENQINITNYENDDKELDSLFENAISEEKNIIIALKDILDECIWLIQKHEPRANHLRFLIAIINSLNDLKRISNYVVSYSKFFAKYHTLISPNMKEIIIQIARFCANKTKLFIDLFTEDDINIGSAQAIFDDFLKEYKQLYLNFINQSTMENNDSNMKASSIIIIKNIDRTIDHCVNIIENFSYVN